LKGLSELGITAERIPNLEEINKIIRQKSGFEGVYVSGLEDGQSFYKMLSEKKFPVGNFIRDRKDLGYTDAVDYYLGGSGYSYDDGYYNDYTYDDYSYDNYFYDESPSWDVSNEWPGDEPVSAGAIADAWDYYYGDDE
jgi:hypothetical protein